MNRIMSIPSEFLPRTIWNLLFSTLLVAIGFAQHRGDNLEFQGMAQFLSYKAGFSSAGVYGASSNDVNALLVNPAGLGTVNRPQASLAFNNSAALWRENQEYRPNRLFVTLPFYLEGLYIPDPANNDSMDYDLALDSSYVVNPPELGQGKFTKAAADWQRSINRQVAYDLAIALPIRIGEKELTLAASFSKSPFDEYDRNHTYLDPHLGYSEYNDLTRLEKNDTTDVNWYNFVRQRSGEADLLTFGIGYHLSDQLSLGLSLQSLAASTDDSQMLDRVGYFRLADENEFSFSYDTLLSTISGKSEFTAKSITLGALINREIISFGIAYTFPFKISRIWDYSYQVETPDTSIIYRTNIGKQTDNLRIPGQWVFGFSIKPHDMLNFYFDLDYGAFSQSELELYIPAADTLTINPADSSYHIPWSDSTSRNWVDRIILRSGLEYTPIKMLSILIGYQYQPQVFVPDGQAFSDQGPVAQGFTVGLRFNLQRFGSFACIYTNQSIKYYDSYYSNTNYAYNSISKIFLTYNIKL